MLAERKELARALDDDARFGEMQMEALPPSPAKAVQELAELRLALAGGPARSTSRSGICSAGRCSTSASPGMKEALQNATDEDRQAVNKMLDDLNDLLEKHANRRGHRRGFREASWPNTASTSRRTRAMSTS